jgi:adenylate cyclase
VVYLAASAISAPLRRLTGEIEGLRNFDVKTAPPERSRIAEIQDLAQALATSKSMLGAFAKYVPKNLVSQIVATGDEPRLGGERRPLTVFFSDVKDFTTISEQVAPERLMEFTSEYLEGLVNLILEHRGTVDKFVGDQVMAYWNAPTPNPEHAADGCRAILACRGWSNAQNERWAREGTPVLYTRFALHLGDAIVGNVGSSDRMDYTVVGATINLGSRIEGLNKVYGTQVLITQPVVAAVNGQFVHRPVDRVLPKGAVHPLDVHELIGALAEVDAKALERCKAWSAFYARYLGRNWAACETDLTAFVAQFGEDTLTRLYAERLRTFKTSPPPADWDGVMRYTTK